MSIADRMTRCPHPYNAERGADALAAFDVLPDGLADLIRGTAGSSPYLAGLLKSEANWVIPAMDDPETAVADILAGVRGCQAADLADHLRQAKRRIALITALADLSGVWPLATVTGTITDFSYAVVHQCITQLVAAEIKRGKLPGMVDADAATGAGMVALAMGKMGARELNYSSDIDLICLFDETRFDPDDYHDARAAFIRVTRKMTAIMQDVTKGGYVFRTDLRLRPDASSTPVCISMETAERYYESLGRTWERAAYIKANPCGGDLAAGMRFLDTLRPFVWRKHLDFAAIQDAHDMRLLIKDHKGLGGTQSLEGHNMKLGQGGIREIEFFTQTRQLISGGRDPSLRTRETVEGLQRLAAAGWITDDNAAELTDHYEFHREIEHRLQMINDAQTHTLPTTDDGFARLAALMGRDVAGLRADIQTRLDAVHELTESFFAPDEVAAEDNSDWGKDTTDRWPTYPALRSDRGQAIFDRLRPDIMRRLAASAKPDEALAQFDGFLAGLPAGVQLFSLFEANPQLTQLIVDIAATAPALAQYLSRNSGVFDAVLGGSFFGDWPGADALTVEAGKVLQAAPDYEAQLIALRRWAKEWHFRIGVHLLRGLTDTPTAGQQYADLAAASIAAVMPVVEVEFARKHGAAPGRGAAVVGMGSLGAHRLTAMSDLDLIVIYDAGEAEMSDGPRPLAVRPYFARLTQALVTALSAPMSEGRLYEVDMRLRPSGRQGPVATSLPAFKSYQLNEAWTWEHLALTRAQPIVGDTGLCAEITEFLGVVVAKHRDKAGIMTDLRDMRRRIADARGDGAAWDAKNGVGRLQDCELLAQAAALRAGQAVIATEDQIAAGVADGWLDAAQADAILRAYRLFSAVQGAARLLTGGVLDPEQIGVGGCAVVLRETGAEDMQSLLTQMDDAATQADAAITALLAGET
ncbi:glutamine-synthetase adenylyltransferase [Loktanella sp. F6476L]|uniref:[protein-PII] uridylyltransferase family protein n=1 Tax=Loktanella sp. F6476L TaxID=2926405 RepID=UPI001FF41F95|nr:glutamine-synthetase adenylyltransferase [Loktanella sp. F6476L]MCK0121616.1 glutamine-synthetase adenylyltransferase [Loktanella sp. F6476L]